jgi:hypothetical protein
MRSSSTSAGPTCKTARTTSGSRRAWLAASHFSRMATLAPAQDSETPTETCERCTGARKAHFLRGTKPAMRKKGIIFQGPCPEVESSTAMKSSLLYLMSARHRHPRILRKSHSVTKPNINKRTRCSKKLTKTNCFTNHLSLLRLILIKERGRLRKEPREQRAVVGTRPPRS